MLFFYRCLWVFLPFWIKRYLKKRALKTPQYLDFWDERFGKPYMSPVKKGIWIHAVSVGETQAAFPLIQELKNHFPNHPLFITQMTPTGRATALSLFPELQCRYLPYDKIEYIEQFLQDHEPYFGLVLETEIWPNLLLSCQKKDILVFLVNARLSEKSYLDYKKIGYFIKPIIQSITKIYAQSSGDKKYFTQLGATHCMVTGNTKYDLSIRDEMINLSVDFKEKIGERKIVLIASTRVEDEINEAYLFIDEWEKKKNNALLIVVPRHPEYFEDVYQYACSKGFLVKKRSQNQYIENSIDILIGDSMGELLAYYLTADVVFVGGSLVNTGCQNIIEPIMCGKVTLFGPSTYNFKQVCSDALKSKSAIQVQSIQEWSKVVDEVLSDETVKTRIEQNTQAFIEQHKGASKRIVEDIVGKMH